MKHKLLLFISVLFLILPLSNTFSQWVQTNGPFTGVVNCLTSNDSVVFAGMQYGIYRSTDHGQNWVAASIYLPYVSTITISGTTVFAGAYRGLYRSTDLGTTWSRSDNGLPESPITSIAFSATTVFVSIGSGWGIYGSTDNGKTWVEKNNGLDYIDVSSLAVIGSTLFAGSTTGIYRSTDQGDNWIADTVGLTNKYVMELKIVGTDIFASTASGIFRSVDSGASWKALSSDLLNIPILGVAAKGNLMLAAAETQRVLRSTDAGNSWAESNSGILAEAVYAVAISGSSALAGAYIGGVCRSTDEGLNWVKSNHGITESYLGINSIAIQGNALYTSSALGVFKTADNGTHWQWCGQGSFVATLGKYVYTTIEKGLFRSSDSGRSWTETDTGINLRSPILRIQSIGPNLFAANGYVYRSIDSGAHWSMVDSESTFSNKLAVMNDGTIFEPEIHGVARSTDDGLTWVSLDTLGQWPFTTTVAVSQNAVLAIGGDWMVLVSTDKGISWKQKNSPPSDPTIKSLVPIGAYVYACTAKGIYRTSDLGDSWTAINNGFDLPENGVYEIATLGDNLFAATSGGVWRMPMENLTISNPFNFILAKAPLECSPNPFHQSTTITLSLKEPVYAQLSIVNLMGAEVAKLSSGRLESGDHSFIWNASDFSAGIYILLVRMNGATQSLPIMLTK